MEFEVKTNLNKKDFLAFYELHQRLHTRYGLLFSRGGCAVAAMLAVVLTVMMFALHLWGNRTALVLYVIFMLLLIALPAVNLWLLQRLYKANGDLLRGEYRFDDKGDWTQTEGMSGIYTWYAFDALVHSGRRYYLYVEKDQAIVLPERSFTRGDPAAFGPFIAEKTGLKIKEIK